MTYLIAKYYLPKAFYSLYLGQELTVAGVFYCFIKDKNLMIWLELYCKHFQLTDIDVWNGLKNCIFKRIHSISIHHIRFCCGYCIRSNDCIQSDTKENISEQLSLLWWWGSKLCLYFIHLNMFNLWFCSKNNILINLNPPNNYMFITKSCKYSEIISIIAFSVHSG